MSGDRTEAATPKRKRDARRKGQVARSTELSGAVSLVAVALTLPVVLPKVGSVLATDWQLTTMGIVNAGPGAAAGLLGRFMGDVAVATLPLVAAVSLSGVAAGLAMTGGKPNLVQLKPRFERINPQKGIKRLFSKQALWEGAKALIKLALVAAVSIGAWQAGMTRLLATSGSLDAALTTVGGALTSTLRRVALLTVVVGVVDATVAHRRHRKQLRMTKQEVKDEMRQSEGNPQMKGAIRGRQHKLSRLRMIAAVATADVVLTNPTHLAIALAYEPGSPAPVVVAKGADRMADRIRAEAARHGVPLMENKPLARGMYRLVEVGDPVPVAFYRAVAEVLALVYRTRPGHRVAQSGGAA